MQYVAFSSDGSSSRDRNKRAYNRIDTLLRRHCPQLYGKYTYNQARILHFETTDNSMTAIAADPSLSVFAQGENDWVICRMVEYKMDSHSRKHRKELKAKTNNHVQGPAGLSARAADGENSSSRAQVNANNEETHAITTP